MTTLETIVTENEFAKLNAKFGQIKLARVANMINKYRELWQLERIQLIPYYSVNILFRVYSAKYGQAVLKIHGQVDCYTRREIAMLAYELPLYCGMFRASEEDGVILLKEARDAHSLHHIKDFEERLNVFAYAFETIHVPVPVAGQFPSYKQLLTNIKTWASEKQVKDLLPYIDEAIMYYEQLKKNNDILFLLHGDFHHDNILYEHANHVVVIDPKGVEDIDIFDIPRFILNELDEDTLKTDKQNIVYVINYLSHKLNKSALHIAIALCIESILSVTWSLQDDDNTSLSHIERYLDRHLYCRQFISYFS